MMRKIRETKNRKATGVSVYLMAVSLFLSGCASMEQSALLGAGVGASAGAGMGIAVEQSAGSALIGAGVGAVIGAAFGYLGHKEGEKKEILKAMGSKRKDLTTEAPMLSAPQASCYRVGEKITGTEYVGPHLRCVIEKNSSWSVR